MLSEVNMHFQRVPEFGETEDILDMCSLQAYMVKTISAFS